MQKGTFTVWLKELCALVFVQTIQAFLLAIAMSIILTFLEPSKGKFASTDAVSALGILCIILLTSLTKMEAITKRIFGLDSGILQNKPPHGLMASWLALKAAGRVLNNVPKMLGGIGSATFGARLDKKKAEANKFQRLNRRGIPDFGATGGVNNQQPQNPDSNDNQGEPEVNPPVPSPAPSNSSHTPNAQNNPRLSNDKQFDEYLKIMDMYDDEISKAKEKRRKGLTDAASGLVETLGATAGGMFGFSAGAMSGLAMGDTDQMFKGAAYGMGVGDAVGENLTKAVANTAANMRAVSKTNDNLDKQLTDMEKRLKMNNENRGRQAKRIKAVNQKLDQTFKNS